MKLELMTVPDDPVALAEWLDRHLVGLNLAQVVAELAAVHGIAGAPPMSVEEVLGEYRQAVMDRGLRQLSSKRLRAFLRFPVLLLDLQQFILLEGGEYWQSLANQPEVTAAVGRGRERLIRQLPSQATRDRGTLALLLRPLFVCLATAAAVMVAVYLFQPASTRNAPPWGWSSPQAMAAAANPAEYLNRLADAGQEWFNKRPEEPVALAQRIMEMRQGCSTLIFASHTALTEPKDRDWLVGKCREWSKKFDEHLASLEGGAETVTVRNAMDETVNRLIGALRSKAKELSA